MEYNVHVSSSILSPIHHHDPKIPKYIPNTLVHEILVVFVLMQNLRELGELLWRLYYY